MDERMGIDMRIDGLFIRLLEEKYYNDILLNSGDVEFTNTVFGLFKKSYEELIEKYEFYEIKYLENLKKRPV